MSISFFYIPTPNISVAKRLSKVLLKKRIIACANIIPQMNSLYWWNNQIAQSNEVVLIVKTTRSKALQLQDWVNQNHPYSIPCIAELAIRSINKDYEQWLKCQITTTRATKTKSAVKTPKVKKSLIV